MIDLNDRRTLGKTGLQVGRLGVSASYGAPANAFEEAFERGCNYFYWGSMRKPGMADAIRNLCGQGRRDDMIILLQSYSRSPALMEVFFERGLKALRIDRADMMLLGWHNKLPSKKILDKALAMKERGLFRFLGISGHNRRLFPELAALGVFDLFHVRYNAAHRGAETEVFPHIQGDSRPGIVSYTATRWGQLLNPKKMPAGEPPPQACDCYRFVLTNPAVDVCMTGPKTAAQMGEALKALELGPLSQEEMARMVRIGDYVHDHTGRFF
jgi:aryl-alcohol dehydrogenase-like predicted oxidoreductase